MIRPIILCKAPIMGQVKTRLMASLSAQQACDIHQKMATHFIHRVSAWYPHAWLAVDDESHPFFKLFTLRRVAQGKGDLGQRMCRLMQLNMASGAVSSLFLGTDSPHISYHRLEAACAILKKKTLVFAPVEDGGYQMIGVRGYQPDIFTNITWGSDRVMVESQQRATQLQLPMQCLSTSFDVDREEDFIRLMRTEHLFKFDRVMW